jgi:hypothetical protein
MQEENREYELHWRLIQAGHTAIFSWVTVYVASGIALVQMMRIQRHTAL